MSKEEEMLRERKRLTTTGITDYQFDALTSTFVIPINGALYTLTLNSDEPLGAKEPQLLPASEEGARMDCKICHADPDLVSFTRNGNIWVTRRSTGIEVNLTRLNDASKKVTAGTPSFIVQEEFNRYTGYWWQESTCAAEPFRILYEEIDESEVDTICITDYRLEGQPDSFIYPRAGTQNEKFGVKVCGAPTNIEDRIQLAV